MNKLNKYINSYFAILLLLLVCAGLFSSCSDDNPVKESTNTLQLDSGRFNWYRYNIQDYVYTLWGCDTDKIYFLGSSSLTIFENNSLQYNNFTGNFYPLCITGFDNKHVYVGGEILNQQYPAAVKRWDGQSFSSIDIPLQFIRDSEMVTGLYAVSQNELWIGTTKGQVIHLDNSNFVSYRFDTTYAVTEFLTDENNNLFFQEGKYVYRDTNVISYSSYEKIYKYETDNWDSVFYYVSLNGDNDFYYPKQVANHICSLLHNKIYLFNGSSFVEAMTVQEGIVTYRPFIGGSSMSDLMIGASCQYQNSALLFHWNGNRWSRERVSMIDTGPVKKIKDRYYCLELFQYSSTNFFMGIPIMGRRTKN